MTFTNPMRRDKMMQYLWTRCVAWNDRYPIGTQIEIEHKKVKTTSVAHVIGTSVVVSIGETKLHTLIDGLTIDG